MKLFANEHSESDDQYHPKRSVVQVIICRICITCILKDIDNTVHVSPWLSYPTWNTRTQRSLSWAWLVSHTIISVIANFLQSAPLLGIAYCLIIVHSGLNGAFKKSQPLSTFKISSANNRPDDPSTDSLSAVSISVLDQAVACSAGEDRDNKTSAIVWICILMSERYHDFYQSNEVDDRISASTLMMFFVFVATIVFYCIWISTSVNAKACKDAGIDTPSIFKILYLLIMDLCIWQWRLRYDNAHLVEEKYMSAKSRCTEW